jgi:hypothetical protein
MGKRSLVISPGEILVEFLEPIDSTKYSMEQRDALNDNLHKALAEGLPLDQKPLDSAAAE